MSREVAPARCVHQRDLFTGRGSDQVGCDNGTVGNLRRIIPGREHGKLAKKVKELWIMSKRKTCYFGLAVHFCGGEDFSFLTQLVYTNNKW